MTITGPGKATVMPPRSRVPKAWDESARLRFLGTVRIFQGLPPAMVQHVASEFRARPVPRGDFIFLEGEPASTLYVLAEGGIKLVRETEDGKEVILRIIRPSDVFGAAGVWGEEFYPASAVAQTNAVVLQLPVSEFTDLLTAHPELALGVIRVLGTRLREAETRIRDLQTEQVERRIASVLLRLANKTGVKSDLGIEIAMPLSRQDLAELSGTTLSTASRTLSAWSQRGIVAVGRQRVVIIHPHALVAIADNLPVPDPRLHR
jgi:CRP-like cAMP-binding protein